MLTVSSTDRVFILTGAGVSAESGIPTFRSAGGLWWNLPNGGGRLVARLATRSPVSVGVLLHASARGFGSPTK